MVGTAGAGPGSGTAGADPGGRAASSGPADGALGSARVIDVAGLDAFIRALRRVGYEVVGPRLRDGAIVYDNIETAADLPVGWTDEQGAGQYRLVRRDDEARFGFASGPQSWKPFLLPPRSEVFQAERDGGSFAPRAAEPAASRRALLGVRPCELAAVAVLDRVFVRDAVRDTLYAAQRDDLFIVAVECAAPGGTCFCASMGTGPGAEAGFDVRLTEVLDGAHRFVARAGSEAGAAILRTIPSEPATAADEAAAEAVVATAAQHMGRSLDTAGLKEALYDNLEHPRWDAVAERCLACGNCTLVCPTCFCTTVVDTSDVTGTVALRERVWDSCFTLGFSYIHGGSIRSSVRARYRQWLTHKLASWHDQFGTAGCVGCGRCITWCPVGIDITAEAAAIRAEPVAPGAQR
jgi:sulfhydrogenase subunit beta (sulfur reductase)